MTHPAAPDQSLWDFVVPAICLGLLAGSLVFTSAPKRPKRPGAPTDPARTSNPGAEPPL
ncbi:hypothetical protein ACIBBB_23725 [Streptomyces sp. NPDC051217]|uniref:hypothetical protein n=1 Tax=Streptomyces sp. NPDC051217 TaxID=3365644 RepID=UPI0037A9D72E